MRTLDGDGVLVRIFIGESDQWHHRPLATALIERLRRAGFSGATVFRGIAGFGAHSIVHTTQILRLSQDLPVLIEVVDTSERIEKLLPILDEMVSEGLVTMEKVRVLKYSHRKDAGADPSS
jgi:PII-like signaling protein